MLEPVPLSDQLAAVRDDAVRVLVVGAGVAGVTLAQLLRRAGLHPVLVERRAADADRGYMLGLMPLVDPALQHLGVEQAYRERSVPVRRYALRDRAGRPLRESTLEGLLAFGDYRGIERGHLLAALTPAGAPVTHDATVPGLEQSADGVRAVLTDGVREVRAEFDAVVAADGMRSATRSLVLPPGQVTGHDTGWSGWVGWLPPDDAPDRYEECWGPGFFIGSYPVQGRIGIFVGGPRRDTGEGRAGFTDRVRDRLRTADGRLGGALTAVAHGVGRLLTGATRESVPAALRRYEARQRPRVLAAQQNSRSLARLLFRTSRPVAVARDLVSRAMPLGTVLAPIRRLLEDRGDAQRP